MSKNFVFTYWDRDDYALISEMITAWRSAFAGFRVFGDSDVLQLLEELQPDFIETYCRIRLPTVKSDVARHLLLYRFGGLYVDSHMELLSRDEVLQLFDRLAYLDHIFVDVSMKLGPRHPEEHFLIPGIMMSRPATAHSLQTARQAMANLSWQRKVEMRDGFTAYSVATLCGPRLFTNMTLQPGTCNRDVRSDLADRIQIIREEVFPVKRNRYRAYSTPGNHWSAREKTELLFER